MQCTHPGAALRRGSIALSLALLAAGCWPPDPREAASEAVLIKDHVAHDLYAAGRVVELRGDVTGDAALAGQTVIVDAAVTGDVLAAGESVQIGGDLRDDVRAAGRALRLTGDVADHVTLAAETLVIGPGARVGGLAWLAGDTVDVRGTIAGDVEIAGETVWILGSIGGDLRLHAEEAWIAEGARIGGDLTWSRGHVPEIHPNARVEGRRIETVGAPLEEAPGIGARIAFVLLGGLALGVVSAALALAFPAFTREAGALLRARPGASLGVGLVAAVAAPLAAGLAFATVIGGLLGVAILLAYFTLLALSVPALLLALTDLGRAREPGVRRFARLRWLGLLALMALVFAGLLQVPIVGPIVGVGSGLFGLGALVLQLARRGVTAGPGAP